MTPRQQQCDVLIIGSGAAGMTAAIVAGLSGLRTIILEKEAEYGGTTAQSGGFIWIPCNHQARGLGIMDSPELASQYIASEAGRHFDLERVNAFLSHGREMVEFLEQKSSVRFEVFAHRPDYHPGLPGGLSGGRSMAPLPFDGKMLGTHFRSLRRPLHQLTFFGMFLGSAGEVEHYFNVTRSLRSLIFVSRQLCRHSLDLLRYGRGARLTRGGALAARLAKSVFDLGIPIKLSSAVESLLNTEGRITGAIVSRADGSKETFIAQAGVILATGGFSGDLERKARVYPHFGRTVAHLTVAAPGSTGDGARMAEQVGGSFDSALAAPAAWMPVSIIPGRSGQAAVFPHLVDRNKPGMIAVGTEGRRFTNESSSYHDFVQSMQRASNAGEARAFLICDQKALDLYGLGFVKPFPVPRRHHLESGYLVRASSVGDLAHELGLPEEALSETLSRFNEFAARGEDPDFGRGQSAYDRSQGDARQRPNPSLRPLDKPPFYAVRLQVADIATFSGIRTDAHARVLDQAGEPIPGLYAAGTDASSVMGGSYPAAGINLGPAMTFGYVAARTIAEQFRGHSPS